jgi:predicted lipid-binding transport protein (Tim44 family)
MFQTILATAHRLAARGPGMGGPGMGGFLFGLIIPVAILLVTVGVFYVLIKLGGLIDSLSEKAEAKK